MPLAPLTNIRLGGPAAYFLECQTEDELRAALQFAARKALRVHLLGGGTNTVFADTGFPGLVVKIGLRGVVTAPAADTVLVTARAGEPWDDVVAYTVEQGMAGMECLSGIPGLVGATPMQNVGAYGQDVSQTITQVKTLERASGRMITFSRADCAFAYRSSRFKRRDRERYIITEVAFRLRTDGVPTVIYPQIIEELGGPAAAKKLGRGRRALQTVREAVIAVRRRKSMIADQADPHAHSCGSFFVNPILTAAHAKELHQQGAPLFAAGVHYKVPAAWLIEHAGFRKGYRRGGVGISAHHPLALVNYSGTTAQLLALASKIQTAVRKKFGVALECEPDLIL